MSTLRGKLRQPHDDSNYDLAASKMQPPQNTKYSPPMLKYDLFGYITISPSASSAIPIVSSPPASYIIVRQISKIHQQDLFHQANQ